MAPPSSEPWDARREGVSALPLEVVEPIDWTHDEASGAVTIRLEHLEREARYKERVRPILEGLEAGDDLPGLVDRLTDAQPAWSRRRAERSARRLVSSLARQGNVEIRLPPVPEVFDGRFERVRELGRGGVGVAWLCRDLEADGARVVVKHAWNWTGPLPRRDRAIREEARVLERLDHPGVVPRVAGFEVEGRFHLARGFVEGEELSDRVLAEGPPGPQRRIELTRTTAGILDHLHERGVLCLDLKPSNLMLEAPEDRVVFADLGHARRMQEGRVELEGPWGSRAYSAPEVHDRHLATPRSDVYGLACLHAFLIRERAPRAREDGDELDASLEAAGAREDERAFLRACLEDDPDDRPRDPLSAVGVLSG